MASTKNKEDVYFAVCNSVLKLQVNKGHLLWNVSELSRLSGITRSLIYYYFGKEKELILETSFKYMSEVFFNTNPDKSLGLRERMKYLLETFKKMPYIFVLYYLEKNRDTEISKIIRKQESEMLKYLASLYPDMTEAEVFDIYLKELGAIAYQLPANSVNEFFPDL